MEINIGLQINWDWRFFALFPAFNFNGHSNSIEFEWLYLGVLK